MENNPHILKTPTKQRPGNDRKEDRIWWFIDPIRPIRKMQRQKYLGTNKIDGEDERSEMQGFYIFIRFLTDNFAGSNQPRRNLLGQSRRIFLQRRQPRKNLCRLQ